jgi:transposase-like protein
VQELLLERGIIVSHEAIRTWYRKFGQAYANQLRHRRPQPGDKWHLDEVFLTINGKRDYLWRAVDQDDNVLDILVQSRRNKQAAKKFFRKLLKGLTYAPRVIITDKLKSYGAAKREILPGVKIRIGRRVNASIACRGSNPPGMPRVFCRRMAPLPNTPDPDGIPCLHRTIAKRYRTDASSRASDAFRASD